MLNQKRPRTLTEPLALTHGVPEHGDLAVHTGLSARIFSCSDGYMSAPSKKARLAARDAAPGDPPPPLSVSRYRGHVVVPRRYYG